MCPPPSLYGDWSNRCFYTPEGTMKKYKCDKCGVWRGSRRAIREHVREIHGVKGGREWVEDRDKKGNVVKMLRRRDPLADNYSGEVF